MMARMSATRAPMLSCPYRSMRVRKNAATCPALCTEHSQQESLVKNPIPRARRSRNLGAGACSAPSAPITAVALVPFRPQADDHRLAGPGGAAGLGCAGGGQRSVPGAWLFDRARAVEKHWRPIRLEPGVPVRPRPARPRSWWGRCRCFSRPTATASSSSTGAGPAAPTAPASRYYPKLVAAAPVHTGHRPTAAGAPGLRATDRSRTRLCDGLFAAADKLGASSIHVLFCTQAEQQRLAERGYSARLGMQFHWDNRPDTPYRDFDDFLSAFRSRNRKQVRHERAVAAGHGLRLETRTGAELDDRDWAALEAFYESNIDKHDGSRYLTPAFFVEMRAAPCPPGGRDLGLRPGQGDRPVAGHAQLRTRRGHLRPLLGLPATSTRCCTSSSATTGSSTAPSPAVAPASRPAPRANTSSSGAWIPRPPTARTGSATPASAPRSSARSRPRPRHAEEIVRYKEQSPYARTGSLP